MAKIVLELNLKKDLVLDFADKIIKYLSERDCEVFFFGDLEKNDLLENNFDYIFSVGGDGTLLNTARKYAKYNKPILGINFGNLGYLTGCEKKMFLMLLIICWQKNFLLKKD